jgi:hypothetical protein
MSQFTNATESIGAGKNHLSVLRAESAAGFKLLRSRCKEQDLTVIFFGLFIFLFF